MNADDFSPAGRKQIVTIFGADKVTDTLWAGLRGLRDREILTMTAFGKRLTNRFKKVKSDRITYVGISSTEDSL